MTKYISYIALLCSIFVTNINAEESSFSFKKNSVITLEEEFRLKDQPKDPFFYEHTDIQYKLLINKYFDVFTDYRLILSGKNGSFDSQNMFIEGFNIKYPEQKWGKINLRTRVEIALNSYPKADTYYLNVFPKYNTPWKWTKFKINPFVADESFYDTLNSGCFVKNRIYAGFDWAINKNIKGSTYYYHENTRNNPWTHTDVAVTQIKFEF